MGIKNLQLSFMAFPQSWAPATDSGGGTLKLNVLVLPVGDPRQPLGGGAAFAGTAIHVVATISDPGQLPSAGTTPLTSQSLVLTPPPVATALFDQLHQQCTAKGMPPTTVAPKTATSARIKKSLPTSYTDAIPVEQPGPDTEIGGAYCCELRGQAPPPNTKPIGPDKSIAWGQVLSLALRQPALAKALGLVYPLTIPVPAGTLTEGGFVYVSLDTSNASNPWVAQLAADPDFSRSYAAQLPALTTARALFAATLTPVVASPGSNLATAQREAAIYDDGFAQVVHCNQPSTIDAATLEPDRIAPATDCGIQLGWDDEQITAWLNSQLDLLNARIDPVNHADVPEAPLGVQGYRLDVRPSGGQHSWSSLCKVSGTIGFTDQDYGGDAATSIDGELWLAPAPVRPSTGIAGEPTNDTNNAPAWLPLYFAQWDGGSAVFGDPVVGMLAAGFSSKPGDPPVSVPPTPNPRPDVSAVPPLRYGSDYEFRVRLVDLTGGGPDPTAQPVHPGPVPTTTAEFRRCVPPKALVVDTHENLPPYPAVPPTRRDFDTLSIRRPRIGYPEALFAGVDPATFAPANVATLIAQARANGDVLDIADPDVGSVNVLVEAKIPAHDTGAAGTDPTEVDGAFRVIYAVSVDFGDGADPEITLTLDYTDGIDDIATMKPPASGATTLPIPTARDVRIRLQPQFDAKTDYYRADASMTGPYSDYVVRKAAANEGTLFAGSAASQLSALYFQPGANIPQLLAQQLNLTQNGLTYSGSPGQRTVFGASGALRHATATDDGALTFSNQTELLGHWIVALTLTVDRDWTWDGFAQPGTSPGSAEPSISITRDGQLVGTIVVPRAIATSTLQDPTVSADRSATLLVFFDAIDPNPAPGRFPAKLTPTYTVTANFEAAAPQTLSLPVTLPITTPPTQTPRIVATGVAESPYTAAADYSSTGSRDRYLWIEFDHPIADSGDDAYFGRVLAYGPDPLLASELTPQGRVWQMLPDSTEPPLPIDPEPVRAVFSGQATDFSGLDAMTRLIPAGPATPIAGRPANTFFLLPLPPGVAAGDLQLFGFWTYEFRVGHATQWSTAQGRFGRALRVSGLQHPPPELTCSVTKAGREMLVTAPYATTVLNGRCVFDAGAGDPQTEMWFMLYAQVMQADGASYRNVLLMHAPGSLPLAPLFAIETPWATGRFLEPMIIECLDRLGLPETSALSVLAVELLPFQLAQVDDVTEATSPAPESEADPLGTQLGTRRILRTSPLTAVQSTC